MKEMQVELGLRVFDERNELPKETRELLEAADEAKTRAYAPYSSFHVGVAVRLENNEIITGNNQENAAYPSGLCAERVAVFYAKSKFPDQDILEICVVTENKNKTPTPPCGSCRQVLKEYEFQQENPIPVYFASETKIYQVKAVEDLLPFGFNKKFLSP